MSWNKGIAYKDAYKISKDRYEELLEENKKLKEENEKLKFELELKNLALKQAQEWSILI